MLQVNDEHTSDPQSKCHELRESDLLYGKPCTILAPGTYPQIKYEPALRNLGDVDEPNLLGTLWHELHEKVRL